MKVLGIFPANAAEMKELSNRDRPFFVAGMGRGIRKIAMRVSGFVEHGNNF